MVSVHMAQDSASSGNGLRPINLRTDLAQLADLMEIVFEDTMDSSGRSAIREMRYLSKMGAGLGLLSNFNALALGVRLGFVWVEDGRLVGNVSVYPTSWPISLGSAWIIANVGVHPDYQRRGIARRLMLASMEMIRAMKGDQVILQVDYDNMPARNLYTSLNFIDERAWTTWRRSTSMYIPEALTTEKLLISHRGGREWGKEYALAQRLRPQARGGLGWLRPLHPSLFRKSLFQRLTDWITLQSIERLVIHAEDKQRILASLWIESGFASPHTQLTLLVD